MRPPALTRSLVGRVALASALAAAIGGTVAALSMGVTAKELVAKHENKSLKAAARELAREVLDELEDAHDEDADEHPSGRPRERAAGVSASDGSGRDAALERALMHELEDVKFPAARAVVHAHGRVLAGDPRLPMLTPGDCELVLLAAREARACSVAMDTQVLTLLVPADAEHDRNVLISRALLVGLLCGALLGGLASFWMARWALTPLTALRDRVRSLRVDAADAEPLGPPARQTELEELRAAIALLVSRLSSALRQAQAFAADAAHELRTPLTTIAGELELYAEEGAPDAAALRRVRTQVAGLTELVQRLLVLAQPSRLDARHAELIDLSDVAEAALEALTPEGRARVTLRTADDVVVRGDAALLRALVVNAIENALKFSREEVRVDIAEVEGAAQIDVVDRGPGVPAAERTRVFTPFYRAAQVRAQGTSGHGIGLSLIARVAWSHGGEAAFLDSDTGAHLRVRLAVWQPNGE